MSGTLSAHSPKFESKLVGYEALAALPEPQALGVRHKPVPHAVLVDAIRRETEARGYEVAREQLALGAKGAALFGVLDLKPQASGVYAIGGEERGLSFGFRNSTDESLGIRAVAGNRVFVCDNLALSGETFAINRKNTTGLDLGDAIATGFDKFLQHAQALEVNIERLTLTTVSDGEAKQLIYDAFSARIVPSRLFDDVDRFYFHPTDETPDTQARTLWGIHNAFTRAMKDLTPLRGFGANVALGRLFGMKDESK